MPALKQELPSSPTYLDPSKSLGEPQDIFVKLPDESTETSPSEPKQEQQHPPSDQESTAEQAESKVDGAVSQETQTWNELKAAARFLSRDSSQTTSQVKANGKKVTTDKTEDEASSKKEEDGEIEQTADKEKEEAEEEESELMKVANNASTKDTPLTTRLLAVAFLNALHRLDENDRNAASLQGCMQVLHLRLESHPHLTTENGGLLDLIARLSSSTRFGHLRLLFLSLIYNSTPETAGGLRLYVLVHTVHLSMITGLTDLVLPGVLERIDGFLMKWRVGKREARKLYLVVAMALEEKGQKEGAHSWYLKYLRTLDEVEEEVGDSDQREEKGIAKKVMVDAINLKTIFRFDALMEMKAIKALKEQKDCEKLCELSQIFVDGDVHDYRKWKEEVAKSENGKKLGDIEGLENVDEDMCLEKMRLLTFSSMGVEAQEMTYEEVSNGLEIEKQDVEDWVVKAIGVGLVDAKMDQLEEKVRIYRSTQRTFSRAEWAPLSDRINVWRANMADLLEALKAARQKSKENESRDT